MLTNAEFYGGVDGENQKNLEPRQNECNIC